MNEFIKEQSVSEKLAEKLSVYNWSLYRLRDMEQQRLILIESFNFEYEKFLRSDNVLYNNVRFKDSGYAILLQKRLDVNKNNRKSIVGNLREYKKEIKILQKLSAMKIIE